MIVATIGATEITITTEAAKLRDRLVTELRNIDTVTDAYTAEEAAAVLRDAKGVLKKLESARAEAKAPAIDIGRKIDALAKEFSADMSAEIDRLAKQLAAWQEEERRRAERARREAEEAERRRLDQLEEERRKRVAEETAAFNRGEGRTGTLSADLEIIEDKAAADIVAIRQEQVVEAAPVKGVKVLTSYKFELTDPAALYAAKPDLCLIELNGPAVRAAMKNPVFAKKALAGEIPGLAVREEKKASV